MPRRWAGEGRVVNRPEDFFARLDRLPGCRHLTHLGSLFPLTDGQSAPNRYFLQSTLHPNTFHGASPMTLTTNNDTEKKARKSLSEQIDRLDSVLDGLADNLNAAVADAVRDAVGGAVREAVQATLLELLAHPEIKSLLQTATASFVTPPPPKPPSGDGEDRPGLRDRLGAAGAWAGPHARAAGQACSRGARWLKAGLLGVWQLRTCLLTAVGLGAAVGLSAYFAGPWLSALAGGALGCAVSLFTRARDWLQRQLLGWAFGDAEC